MEKKKERIKFWLTDKELKQIDRKSRKLGMNRSEYIRHLIADTFKPIIIALIINARRVYKLTVGNDITDIFRAIHTELSCFAVNLF